MANNQKSATPSGPWRAGRPSFKAFYPEIFILTLITIAFIAIAIKLSCSTLRNARNGADNTPTALQFDAPLLAPIAYAQDDPISQPTTEDTSATSAEVAPEGKPAASVANPGSVEIEPVSTVVPSAEKSGNKVSKKSESPWVRIIWIWVVCLIVPTILWIWRGIVWICAVFGIYYELRVDPDNPRATTFLTTRGILNKETNSLHIGSIKDIQSSQSFLQKYFMGGVGTIVLLTTDVTDSRVEMKNMADPSRVFNALDTLRRHFWSRGGMQLHGGAGDEDGAFSEQIEG